MLTHDLSNLIVEQIAVPSSFLNRQVIVDVYLPKNIPDPGELSLLLVNDGQDLEEMRFATLLDGLLGTSIQPLVCAAIHAGKDRRNEYGTVAAKDFAGRGAKAGSYEKFILDEFLPLIQSKYGIDHFRKLSFAGFSLGGLTALDITWRHPQLFSVAGVFSGSLWWRAKSLEDDYNEDTDRIMHSLIRRGSFHPGLRFYFTTGSLDETADRNGNGIIDSIDDTLALISELENVGYSVDTDIRYINYEDGKHDVATWGRAFPQFLLWGWSKEKRMADAATSK